jgi:hypothetical protein
LGLFSILYMDYLQKSASHNAVSWDVATVTAADYTVEFDLPENFFKEWDETQFLEYSALCSTKRGPEFEGFVSRSEAFRDWLKN